MIVPYTDLPAQTGGDPRPLVDVQVADMDDALVPCLVDSGSVHSLLPRWVADAAGLALSDDRKRNLAVAGTSTRATFVPVDLTVAGLNWEADVGFCDPWPYVWGLLGQRSFFRFFTVTLRAVDFEFELAPLQP
ncbi:MAG: aspartyl protease family protein [Acidimicrobiia bacterium]|nr:aspartyl protease family protein [Acidimicrobiia bacterium]